MGTRGFLGFVANGAEKIGYNHNDSYPDHLGVRTLAWLRGADVDAAFDAAVELRVVDPESTPSDEDVAAFAHFTNTGVGGRSDQPTWYQLLRRTQGEAGQILEAGAIEDASNFPADSLFAEWGYVIDFDASVFEVYRGFQKAAHEKGRFAGRTPEGNGYFPVALVASWPIKELPTDVEFLAAFGASED